MIKKLSTILLFSCVLINPLWASRALIVTIDQKHFPQGFDQKLEAIPVALGQLNWAFRDLGAFGRVAANFDQKTQQRETMSVQGTMDDWDAARADWIRDNATQAYDEGMVFVVTGEDARNESFMRSIWALAMQADVVDYVSMVHDDLSKIGMPAPEELLGKLRLFYTEGCKFGNGAHINALISAGHTKNTEGDSASPLFTFFFLENWFNGASFSDSLQYAWLMGIQVATHPAGFILAQLLGGYSNSQEIIDASRYQYAYNPFCNPSEINIVLEVPSFDAGSPQLDGEI